MKNTKSKMKIKNRIAFITSIIILTLSFQFNIFNAAPEHFFRQFQNDSESLVIGRIIKTHEDGYFSNAGFMGRYKTESSFPYREFIKYQFDTYLNGDIPESPFIQYTSSTGIQGFFYGMIDSVATKIGIKSGEKRYFINKVTTSLLSSVVLSLFVIFSLKYFGLSAAITSTFFMALSQWLVSVSNNLYWMFFLIIFPFVATCLFLMKHSISGEKSNLKALYCVLFFSILLKSLAGYEYMSSIFIAMITPCIFFAIKDGWGIHLFIRRSIAISIAAILGFFTALIFHAIQLTYQLGSIQNAFSRITGMIKYRTHGDLNHPNELIRKSMESNTMDNILKYLDGQAFYLDGFIGFGGVVPFWHVILFLFFVSLVGYLVVKISFPQHKKLNHGILTATWFSALAPLSWFILAKGHSYVHFHLNYVLWYIPFLLLGFSYAGFIIGLLAVNFFNLKPIQKFYFSICLAILASVVSLFYLFSLHKEKMELLSNANLIESFDDTGISLYYSGTSIFYSSKNCGENLDTRFFFHAYPVSPDNLLENMKNNGYLNLDFLWKTKQIYGKYFPRDVCATSIQLPNYPLSGIRTGQYIERTRLWQNYIDLSEKRFVTSFQPFNLSDAQWQNGIHRTRASFFVENTFPNRQSLKIGDALIFSGSGERMIQNLSYSDRYINIIVSGASLSPETDGYPHTIETNESNSINTRKMKLLSDANLIESFDDAGISLYHSRTDIAYSSKNCTENLDTRFFLHAYPANSNNLPESMKANGYFNLDFLWNKKQIYGKHSEKDVCVASIGLPIYPISGILTGQYDSQGRLWQNHIDLNGRRFVTSFQPFNLSDTQWENGIHRTRAGFFVENSFQNRQSLKIGDTLEFSSSGERTIQNLTYSERYINIIVSGEPLVAEEDGYPHSVEIKNPDARNH